MQRGLASNQEADNVAPQPNFGLKATFSSGFDHLETKHHHGLMADASAGAIVVHEATQAELAASIWPFLDGKGKQASQPRAEL